MLPHHTVNAFNLSDGSNVQDPDLNPQPVVVTPGLMPLET